MFSIFDPIFQHCDGYADEASPWTSSCRIYQRSHLRLWLVKVCWVLETLLLNHSREKAQTGFLWGICQPVALKVQKGQFSHWLLVWPVVWSNSMSITGNLAHIPTMDGLSGIKPKKAGRSPSFFRNTLCKAFCPYHVKQWMFCPTQLIGCFARNQEVTDIWTIWELLSAYTKFIPMEVWSMK